MPMIEVIEEQNIDVTLSLSRFPTPSYTKADKGVCMPSTITQKINLKKNTGESEVQKLKARLG